MKRACMFFLVVVTVCVCVMGTANGNGRDGDGIRSQAGDILHAAEIKGGLIVYNGLVLFGSADGYVYCLRADSVALVWRFLAAQRDQRIVAHEQLESVWPVHGAVLVMNGLAYVSSGRTSLLDEGIAIYVIKPETGEVVSEKVFWHPCGGG